MGGIPGPLKSVVRIVSETPYTRTTKVRGVPTIRRMRTVVYMLDCGHETTRKIKRLAYATAIGRRMRCYSIETSGQWICRLNMVLI